MIEHRRTWLTISLLAAGSLLLSPIAAATQPPGASSGSTSSAPTQAGSAGSFKPVVRSAVRHDTSQPLRRVARVNARAYHREMRKQQATAQPRPVGARQLLPKARTSAPPAIAGSRRVQRSAAPGALMPDFLADFEGVGNIDEVYPPDTNGDVGGDWYVQWVNLHFQVFNKTSGASVLGPLPGNALWEGFGGACEAQNDGDPIAQYDALSNRWMMSQFAVFSPDGNHQCIAISQTDDPTGAWYRYDFLISTTIFNDYPHFGVWPDAYYMSINQFDTDTFEFAGAGAVAFERDQMLLGQPAEMVYFSLQDVDLRYGGQLPSDLDGAAPPTGAPNLFLEADDDAFGFPTDRINAWKFHVDWDNTASSTFGNAGQPDFSVDTAAFDASLCGFDRSCIPQPGTSQGLDAISDRLMYRAQYRNFGDHQSLVLNHTVDADGNDHAGVRWYELRSTDGGDEWDVQQQGTYAPDADNRWMASAAMDVSGNIAVGYSVSSSSTFPSIRVAGRLADDPAGELAQAESELVAGSGVQTGEDARWGDYSAMQVDPADQCTFYYTSEYIQSTGFANWQTRVGSFTFPSCSAGPSGTISGTVTAAGSGDPIADATVTAGASSTSTTADGTYSLRLPVGSYDMTASAFGYDGDSAAGVEVLEDQTTTRDFQLTAQPMVSVSGTVRDGSGHGWPVYAKVGVEGTPLDPVFTDPGTGFYSVDLPAGETYTFDVTAQYPGYDALSEDVEVAGGDVSKDFRVTVDLLSCTAPGYAPNLAGAVETFDSGSLPPGWSVADNSGNGEVWAFDDPGGRGNLTGGEGGFAVIDSDFIGPDGSQDTSLVSPPVDLTGQSSPVISFAEDFNYLGGESADVDVSIDGGASWATALSQNTDARGPLELLVPLPQAANQPDVQIRFHYYDAAFAWWWEVDDVFFGNRSCDKVRGGLVYGDVTDANTGDPLNAATVTSVDAPADKGVSAATSEDPNVPDGFYWLFSSLTGTHPFTATDGKYTPQTEDVSVRADWVRQQDFSLTAGVLSAAPRSLRARLTLGGSTTRTFDVTNSGTAPAEVKIGESAGDFVILGADGSRLRGDDALGAAGAPLKLLHGTFLPFNTPKGTSQSRESEGRDFEADPWTDIADYPTDIMDNAMAFDDGRAYSLGGVDGDGVTAGANVYDPTTLSWSAMAEMPEPREKPGAAFIGGLLYVVGGWGADGEPAAATLVYDPISDSWTTAADMLAPVAAPATAVVDGLLYAIGGCDSGSSCGVVDTEVYDPATDSWTPVADYPEETSWQSCGEINGSIYCAGGTSGESTSSHAYQYDPGSDSWTPMADLPIDLWASGYTAANGLLLVSGGVTDGFDTVTNQGFAYDPANDSWSGLPNANEALYRGGSSCGFYRVGGSAGGFAPDAAAAVLPGFDQCGTPVDVGWLKERPKRLTLAPGVTRTVAVRFDSGQVTQPGVYTAAVIIGHHTPYRVDPVSARMRVQPPRSWGKLLGTVRGRACDGTRGVLPGATVQVNGRRYHQTLLTGQDGGYAIWLDSAAGRLRLIVAKDAYVPTTRTTLVEAGEQTTEGFTLTKSRC